MIMFAGVKLLAMDVVNRIIGRQKEMAILREVYDSSKAEFVAVYGRRRIGKTFLVDKTFEGKFDFYMTGIYEGSRSQQLTYFAQQMMLSTGTAMKTPNNWQEALFALYQYLVSLKDKERIVVFIDELPWLDTPRSGFLKAFEVFWNSWASKLDNMKLIVCGSATTWMTNKLLGNKGGLHNRVTKSIYLRPFNLGETEAFLRDRGFVLQRRQVVEAYMALGGTPYYLDMMRKSLSVAQNIDYLFFAENAPLRYEYEFLFKSLFKESSSYRRVVEALAKKMKGMTRKELLAETKLEDSGFFSDVLTDLCNCDFIRKYSAFGKTERDVMYQLTDLYSLFYLRFVKNYHGGDVQYWSHRQKDISQWEGYAFEQVCLHHIPQIKSKLGINGVQTDVCSWSCQSFTDSSGKEWRGAQIDLVIDRADRTINLCEMKFSDYPYTITTEYAERLLERRDTFRIATSTRKTIHLTMVTSFGVERNEGWQNIQSEVVMDDLFRQE